MDMFVFICDESAFHVVYCYDRDIIYNDLLYSIKYIGDNMEDGIKHFMQTHPSFPKGTIENNKNGLYENQMKIVPRLNELWKLVDEYNFEYVYLAFAWRLINLYLLTHYKIITDLGWDDYTQRIYELKSVIRDIEFRANIVSLKYNNKRQILSLFDPRTWNIKE